MSERFSFFRFGLRRFLVPFFLCRILEGQAFSASSVGVAVGAVPPVPALQLCVEKACVGWSLDELKKMALSGASLRISHDPTIGGDRALYRTVPLAKLLTRGAQGVSTLGSVLNHAVSGRWSFRCADGFGGPIDGPLGLAHLAVEIKPGRWPKAVHGGVSRGPLLLVWPDGVRPAPQDNQWPFQLVELRFQPGVGAEGQNLGDSEYPKHRVAEGGARPEDLDVWRRGYRVFAKNCLVCHKLNQEGPGTVGPDLNAPQKVTDYIKRDVLVQLIRDHRQVRHWPGAKMPPFPESLISPGELNDLLAYLESLPIR